MAHQAPADDAPPRRAAVLGVSPPASARPVGVPLTAAVSAAEKPPVVAAHAGRRAAGGRLVGGAVGGHRRAAAAAPASTAQLRRALADRVPGPVDVPARPLNYVAPIESASWPVGCAEVGADACAAINAAARGREVVLVVAGAAEHAQLRAFAAAAATAGARDQLLVATDDDATAALAKRELHLAAFTRGRRRRGRRPPVC